MKISIKAYKDTVSWESEQESADIQEVINQIKGLLVAVGYHPKNVDACFVPDAFEWFPEEDVEKIEWHHKHNRNVEL